MADSVKRDKLLARLIRENESASILQIVADHIHRDVTCGGLDWDDLIEDLRRAGYTLPDPTEHPKEN
jgi:sugar phosphate isomerase/epimerase